MRSLNPLRRGSARLRFESRYFTINLTYFLEFLLIRKWRIVNVVEDGLFPGLWGCWPSPTLSGSCRWTTGRLPWRWRSWRSTGSPPGEVRIRFTICLPISPASWYPFRMCCYARGTRGISKYEDRPIYFIVLQGQVFFPPFILGIFKLHCEQARSRKVHPIDKIHLIWSQCVLRNFKR